MKSKILIEREDNNLIISVISNNNEEEIIIIDNKHSLFRFEVRRKSKNDSIIQTFNSYVEVFNHVKVISWLDEEDIAILHCLL